MYFIYGFVKILFYTLKLYLYREPCYQKWKIVNSKKKWKKMFLLGCKRLFFMYLYIKLRIMIITNCFRARLKQAFIWKEKYTIYHFIIALIMIYFFVENKQWKSTEDWCVEINHMRKRSVCIKGKSVIWRKQEKKKYMEITLSF